jgi:cell wall-associated NlpC family hydrolase
VLSDNIIKTGMKYLGTPYVFNSSPYQTNTFDCSSFMQHIFKRHGVTLPRNSRQQYRAGVNVPYSNIQKGDLLFFTTPRRMNRQGIEKIGHVAIYIGQGRMLHTSRREGKVSVVQFAGNWKERFIGAKRFG